MKNLTAIFLLSFFPLFLMSQTNTTDTQKELQGLNTKVSKLQNSVTGTKAKLAGLQETNHHLVKLADSLKVELTGNSIQLKQLSDSITVKLSMISLADKRINEISEALVKRKTYTITGAVIVSVFGIVVLILLLFINRKSKEMTNKLDATSKSLDTFIDAQGSKFNHFIQQQEDSVKEINRKISSLQSELSNQEARIGKSVILLQDELKETAGKTVGESARIKSEFELHISLLRKQITELNDKTDRISTDVANFKKKA